MSSGLWSIDRLPRRVRPHHGAQDREQLAHTGDERDFLRPAGRDEDAHRDIEYAATSAVSYPAVASRTIRLGASVTLTKLLCDAMPHKVPYNAAGLVRSFSTWRNRPKMSRLDAANS